MKTLFLLRHAKSGHDHASLHDIERPLTERGYSDAKMVSEHLVKENLIAETIVASPAIRTYSTALVFASAFNISEDQIHLEKKLYDSSVVEYLRLIGDLDDKYSNAMLVGHNELISDAAGNLLNDESFESLSTCGVVIISSEATTWKAFSNSACTCQRLLNPSLFKVM